MPFNTITKNEHEGSSQNQRKSTAVMDITEVSVFFERFLLALTSPLKELQIKKNAEGTFSVTLPFVLRRNRFTRP